MSRVRKIEKILRLSYDDHQEACKAIDRFDLDTEAGRAAVANDSAKTLAGVFHATQGVYAHLLGLRADQMEFSVGLWVQTVLLTLILLRVR